MKKTIFILILLVSSFSINAQVVAVKTKTFYWGNSDKIFFDELTDSGKLLLDSCLKIVHFDSSNCIRLTSEDQLKYTSRAYLSKHNYQYLTIYRQGDNVSIRKYHNVVYGESNTRKKVLLKYSKDFNNEIDRVSVHIID